MPPPAITINLGSVNLGSFINSQTAGLGEQDISLTCEQGTAISASLTAQPASGNNPDNSVIQLSNADAPTSATGVGVQLGIQAQDSGFYTDSLPINKKIDLFTHTHYHECRWQSRQLMAETMNNVDHPEN
ncbi:fimbrial protein [Salmonella bongori]|nr:fimbrial protein [Salmonella bongori]